MKKNNRLIEFKLQYIDKNAPDNRETYKALKERYQVETTLDTFKICYLDAPVIIDTPEEETELLNNPLQFVSPMIGVQDSIVKERDSQNRTLSAYEPFFSPKQEKDKDAKTIKRQFDLNDTEDYKKMLRGEYDVKDTNGGYQVVPEAEDEFSPFDEKIDDEYMQPIAHLYEDDSSTYEYVEEDNPLPFEDELEEASEEQTVAPVVEAPSYKEETSQFEESNIMDELEDARELERPVQKQTFKPTPAPSVVIKPTPKPRRTRYVAPPLNLLKKGGEKTGADTEWAEKQKEIINSVFREFNYGAKAFDYIIGPTVTLFKIEIEPGTDINKINSFTKALTMRLCATSLRIQDPIPGLGCAGIEIPNAKRAMVLMGNLVTKEFLETDKKLKFVLGLNLKGESVYGDIEKMPHCLVAGQTGSGKSVCIHAMIISLIYHNSPDELRFILIDPKMVEFSFYNDIPHLAMPVIIDTKKAVTAFRWACEEMDRRYDVFRINRVRDIQGFNSIQKRNGSPLMPRIVIVIDELHDIMLMAGNEVEEYIMRLGAKARSAGIHVILATQRPSTDVIKGTLKNNIPTRIALKVKSPYDSNTIIDHGGAEKLLGNGDLLFANEMGEERIQGAYLSDQEITDVCNFLVDNNETQYLIDTKQLEEKIVSDITEDEEDEKFEEICYYAVRNSTASANQLMQEFKISFNRINRILLKMENMGIISSTVKGKQREVLVTEDELSQILDNNR